MGGGGGGSKSDTDWHIGGSGLKFYFYFPIPTLFYTDEFDFVVDWNRRKVAVMRRPPIKLKFKIVFNLKEEKNLCSYQNLIIQKKIPKAM